MSDGRQNNGGSRQGSGRKKKNLLERRITFNPTQEVLDIWDSWEDKTGTIEKAIVKFNEEDGK